MVIKFEIEHTIKTGQEANALEMFRDLRRNVSDCSVDSLYRSLLITQNLLGQEAENDCLHDYEHFCYFHALLDGPAKIRLRLSS